MVISQIAANIKEVLQSKQADKLEILAKDFEGEVFKIFSNNSDMYNMELINQILNCSNQIELMKILRQNFINH